MSYCRWSECDVYAYDSCEGGVRFYVAGDDSLNRLCGTYNEAYQYAKELRDKHGLDVPSYAIDALREDAIDEAKRYFGSDSAVAERISENAKLREEVEQWHRLTAGIELPEYPITQFQPKDLERENAKLRKLVAKYSAAAKYLCGFSHCNECNLDCASVFGDVPSGWDCARMLLDKKARELGVEVDDA